MRLSSFEIQQIYLVLGLDQAAFAQRVKVSVDIVRHWEMGTVKPLPSQVKRIEALLNKGL